MNSRGKLIPGNSFFVFSTFFKWIFNITARAQLYIMFIFIDYSAFLFNNINIMGRKSAILLPSVERKLSQLGNQIKMARLRRHIPVQLVAERAGISRATLWAVEKKSFCNHRILCPSIAGNRNDRRPALGRKRRCAGKKVTRSQSTDWTEDSKNKRT